jgi:riboflavin synthase
MFTGLIQNIGKVESFEKTPEGARLRISTGLGIEIGLGDSVAVNGVCLTATAADENGFETEAMNQTLAVTALGGVETGGRVNLELAMRPSDRLGGHIVQGHVDGVGRVRAVEPEGEGVRLHLDVPPDVLRYCVEKGSITVAGVSLTVAALDDDGTVLAIEDDGFARRIRIGLGPGLLRYAIDKGSICLDGVSLTVAALGDDWVEVSLIPETLERTTLADLGAGSKLNVECDVVAKYVERLSAPIAGKDRV